MRLSVCIITYNHERFIEQAVTSALTQETEFPFEIIIGEDASTDATAAILHRIEAAFPGRLRVEHRGRNIGARANFIRTLEACRGEFVAFLEGDDFWTSPVKLQRQVDFLDAHPEVSFCFHRTRSLNEAAPDDEFVLPPSDPPAVSSLDFLLQASNPVALGSIVARRNYLADLPDWFPGLKLGDWPLCFKLASHGGIGFIAEEMSRYRIHPGGSWSRLSPYQRVAYSIQMLLRVRSLLSGEQRATIERRAGDLADWWGGDLVSNQAIAIEPVVEEIVRTNDPELLSFLFARTLNKARGIHQASQWFASETRRLQHLADRTKPETVSADP